MIKERDYIKIGWPWVKLREWLRKNCVDIETMRLGDLRYCLQKYFEVIGKKKPCKKATLVLLQVYNDPTSPIYKGVRVPGLTLKKKKRKQIKSEYDVYIKSTKWKMFKQSIISERGNTCEKCRSKSDFLDLHHKTYARLGNELKEDVMLLCRPCHKEIHGS